jgi:hypothetical protein
MTTINKPPRSEWFIYGGHLIMRYYFFAAVSGFAGAAVIVSAGAGAGAGAAAGAIAAESVFGASPFPPPHDAANKDIVSASRLSFANFITIGCLLVFRLYLNSEKVTSGCRIINIERQYD